MWQILSLVKPSLEFESYVFTPSRFNVKYRQAVTRFRMSAHRFRVKLADMIILNINYADVQFVT